jgi:hypothetical protein
MHAGAFESHARFGRVIDPCLVIVIRTAIAIQANRIRDVLSVRAGIAHDLDDLREPARMNAPSSHVRAGAKIDRLDHLRATEEIISKPSSWFAITVARNQGFHPQ